MVLRGFDIIIKLFFLSILVCELSHVWHLMYFVIANPPTVLSRSFLNFAGVCIVMKCMWFGHYCTIQYKIHLRSRKYKHIIVFLSVFGITINNYSEPNSSYSFIPMFLKLVHVFSL